MTARQAESARRPGRPPWAAIILAAGFLLRFFYLLEFRETPYFFAHLLSGHDQRTWAEMALRILERPWLVDGRPFYQAPGYAYFLAAVFRLAGPANYLAAGIVQAMMDMVSAGFLYLVGKRLWNERVGLAACLVYAFYRPFVIYSVTILSDSFILFTNLLCLFLFLRVVEEPGRAGRWAGAGLAFGIAAATRPTVLLFLFFGGLAFLFTRPVKEPRAKARPGIGLPAGLGLFCLFFLVPVLPIVIRNSMLAGHFVTVATYGRINWEIGNSANSIGLYLNPFDLQAPPLGPLLSPWSAGFWRLQGLKALFFITAYEWPQNLNLYLLTDISRVLSLPLFNIGLVMPAGLAGMIAAADRRRHQVVLYTVAGILGTVAFFVTSRYRLPAMAGLILCACGLADLAWRTITPALRPGPFRPGSGAKLLAACLAILFLLSYTLVNTWRSDLVSEVYARNYRIMTRRAAEYHRAADRPERAAALEKRQEAFDRRYRAGDIR